MTKLLHYVFLNVFPSSWLIMLTLASVIIYPTFPDWFKLVWGMVVIVQIVMIMRVWDHIVRMCYETFRGDYEDKELRNYHEKLPRVKDMKSQESGYIFASTIWKEEDSYFVNLNSKVFQNSAVREADSVLIEKMPDGSYKIWPSSDKGMHTSDTKTSFLQDRSIFVKVTAAQK